MPKLFHLQSRRPAKPPVASLLEQARFDLDRGEQLAEGLWLPVNGVLVMAILTLAAVMFDG